MDTLSKEEWATLAANLREPFAPEDIDFRPGARNKEKTRALALAYVTSRAVMDRLDRLVGAQNWAYTYEPLHVSNDGVLKLAKAVLTIYGVRKEDIGDASATEPSKGTVSDGLKRVAVQWGMGRELYDLPQVWLALNAFDRFEDSDLRQLRAKLPRPKTHAAPTTDEPAAPVFTPTPRAVQPGEGDELDYVYDGPGLPVTPAPPARPAPPMRQRSDEPAERAHVKPGLDRMGFISAIAGLGLDPKEAMDRLGVRSLSGIDLDAALEALEAQQGIAKETGMVPGAVTLEPEEEPEDEAKYPADIRADGAPDMSIAEFLKECAKLGYKGTGALQAIQAKLGVPDLMGISYGKALKKLATFQAGEPKAAAKTNGAAKPTPIKTEPGGGANGRAALRRLAHEAGVEDARYMDEYRALFGDDMSHESEVLWTAYLEGVKAKRTKNRDGSARLAPDLHDLTGAPLH